MAHWELACARRGSAGLIRVSMGLMGQAHIRSWSPGLIGIDRDSLIVESGLSRGVAELIRVNQDWGSLGVDKGHIRTY